MGLWSQWLRGNRPNQQAAEVPDLREALPRIIAEFQRARRYERTLTIAVFTVEESGDRPSASGHDGDGSRNGHGGRNGHGVSNAVMPVALASALRQAMRETDLVAWDPSTRRSIVVMPEIGTEEGRRAVKRMRDLCASQLACAARADIAEFPGDGWTFEELAAVAQDGGGRLREPREKTHPTVVSRPAKVEPLGVTASE